MMHATTLRMRAILRDLLDAGKHLATIISMRTALVTVFYPEALQYVSKWKTSVQKQDAQNFDLVIGLNGLSAEDVDISDISANVQFVDGSHGMSLRRTLFQGLADTYDAAVLVDADDILLPRRVRVACDALREADVYGCAMHIVDEQLTPLDMVFPVEKPPITHGNVWGCSNTAYRTEVLCEAARFPDTCVLADWYMATLATSAGAQFVFDANPAMQYRVRSGAPTNPSEPYTPSVLRQATNLVEDHLKLVSNDPSVNLELHEQLQQRLSEVVAFRQAIQSDDIVRSYLQVLQTIVPSQRVWWECVAHTMLKDLWNM